ncbi:glutathione hydrolase 7-like isoform X1 [Portunus trituberculatus]|uniref:glutathione hydrolase 7-like isoform X1 n=2 Tax=Portunus trituberculatus TaxID=210409 RepID=UPI001E1D048D|nr:glutathione hydrolase 7-like isoform X1 [Portunus trituberculatus]
MILTDHTGTHGYTEESVLRPHPLYSPKKRHCCHGGGDGFTIISTCFFILTIAITVALIIQIYYGSPEVMAHGAVATDEEECSRVGASILAGGGSAVDVAVASVVCLMVVHPHTVGPGGSGVMLVHDHKMNTTTIIDFQSAVPSAYNHQNPPPGPTEARSVGVPGLLRGLEHAHRKFGKLPWEKLINPSIDIARRGFNVSAQLEDAIKKLNITKSSGDTLFEHFFFPKGHMLKKGDFIQRENFAELLDIVAVQGANTFYNLDFDHDNINAMQAEGAEIQARDFRAYQVQEWPSVQMTLRNHTIHTSPAFSGGAQLLAALHLLKHANITTTTPQHHLYHTFIQAIRTSYAYLIHLGLGVEAGLTNRTELETEELDAEFDGETDTPLPRQLPEQAGSPVSVMDTFDQYVATVVGLGTHFGSRYMTRHGILFNNHLSNLRATAGAGYVPSRPVTSYTPVVITDMNRICGPRVVLSSPEVGAAVQVVGQLIFRDRPLIDAIKQRRVTVSADNNLVLVDDLRSDEVAPLPGDVRNYLEAQNNTLRILYPPYAGVNGITKDKDALTSWSDSRGGGVAHRLEPPVKPKPEETQTPPPTPPPEVVTPGEPQMMP